jgi:hypothetical protein
VSILVLRETVAPRREETEMQTTSEPQVRYHCRCTAVTLAPRGQAVVRCARCGTEVGDASAALDEWRCSLERAREDEFPSAADVLAMYVLKARVAAENGPKIKRLLADAL